ncbi:MAG: esterase family protein [Sphingobacteriales bacterium]|nr:esterase family protein [Sphingobacteriales bacterium]
MKKLLLHLFCFLLLYSSLKGATVDTISIYSSAMHKEFKCVVIKPASYNKHKQNFPVVYLLHGYDGWYSNWIIREPKLKNYADQYQLIIVCPDGGKSSWYFDSPIDSTMKYETYISKEVPDYIDKHYYTIVDRKARAITGLSMGGHGALFLAFRHSETFGACGSMSGGVDLNYSRNKFDIMKRIGDTISHADNWKKYIVMNVIENYPKDSLVITIDCGNNDELYAEANRKLHEKMLKLKIPHDYTERPGKHNWDYWRNSIQYHLLFFRNYFGKMKVVEK